MLVWQIKNLSSILKKHGHEVRGILTEKENLFDVIKDFQPHIIGYSAMCCEKNKILKITLKYDSGVPAIAGSKRVSKPGQRIYEKAANLKKVRGGFGLSVVSTPKGLMTNVQAKKAKLGGEVLLEVW